MLTITSLWEIVRKRVCKGQWKNCMHYLESTKFTNVALYKMSLLFIKYQIAFCIKLECTNVVSLKQKVASISLLLLDFDIIFCIERKTSICNANVCVLILCPLFSWRAWSMNHQYLNEYSVQLHHIIPLCRIYIDSLK